MNAARYQDDDLLMSLAVIYLNSHTSATPAPRD